jgi:thioredoxin 1
MSTPAKPTTDLVHPDAADALMSPDGGAAILDFWAPWCAPCRAMAPHFEAVAARHAGGPVKFLKVNTEAHPELGEAFHVRSLPTLLLVHNGEILDVAVGAMDAARLEKKVAWLASRARGDSLWDRLLGRPRKDPAAPPTSR